MNTIFLFAVLGVSYGIQPLTTKDGFGLTFSGDKDPSISGVSIDGSSVSESLSNKGGFGFNFLDEEQPGIVLSDNIIKNGDLTESGNNWRGTGVFEENSGRGGTGAICLTSGLNSYQGFTFNASNENAYGVRISGWSKATDADGEEDSDYSLYMDIAYKDGTKEYEITDNFPVGTHDYVYRERFHQFKGLVRSFTLYMLYRNGHKSGKVCFDDISVQLYQSPPVSEGTITAVNSTSYQQVSTVHNSKLTVDYTAKENHIQVKGLLESVSSMKDKTRAVTLSFGIPVSVSEEWNWGSGLAITKLGNYNGGSTTFKIRPKNTRMAYDIDKLLVAGISSDKAGVGIGVKPGSVFSFRLSFSGATSMLMVSMEFSLSPLNRIPSSAWFEFAIFKLDKARAAEPFRSTLDKYCKKVYPEIYTQRVILDQGLWMPFTDISSVEGWEDFGFKFYEGSNDLAFNTKNGIRNYPYIEPTILHHNFYDEDPKVVLEKLKECNTSKCKRAYSSYISRSDGGMRYRKEESSWNNGTIMPVNGNPNIPGEINAGNYMLKAVDDNYKAETNKSKIDGVYVDSIGGFESTADYRSENFKYLGATPGYDTNHTPVTPFGAWTYDFLSALAQKVRKERGPETTIMGNGVYTTFPHLSPFIDVPGTETKWLSNNKYSPLSYDVLFSYRVNSFQKPYLFLQNSNFNVWTKEMSDKYMQRSLLYGIWPGYFSANAATDRYFRNSTLYNRDRPLFKKYIPVLKTITSQGWEPVTCMASEELNPTESSSVLYVERWGGSSGFPVYFTMRATTSSKDKAKYNVTIDLRCLGVGGKASSEMTLNVTEICQQNATVKSDSKETFFEFEFQDETTYVFKIDGEVPSGDEPSGEVSSGDEPSGEVSSGDESSGDEPSGEVSSGDKSSGEVSSGDEPSGDESSGDEPSGDKSSGDDPNGASGLKCSLLTLIAVALSAFLGM